MTRSPTARHLNTSASDAGPCRTLFYAHTHDGQNRTKATGVCKWTTHCTARQLLPEWRTLAHSLQQTPAVVFNMYVSGSRWSDQQRTSQVCGCRTTTDIVHESGAVFPSLFNKIYCSAVLDPAGLLLLLNTTIGPPPPCNNISKQSVRVSCPTIHPHTGTHLGWLLCPGISGPVYLQTPTAAGCPKVTSSSTGFPIAGFYCLITTPHPSIHSVPGKPRIMNSKFA